MNEILQWVLVVIAISIPAIIVALINYFLYKEKIVAETENIKEKTKNHQRDNLRPVKNWKQAKRYQKQNWHFSTTN